MANEIHPEAAHHLPFFITFSGQFDILLGVVAVVVIVAIGMIGVFYFRISRTARTLDRSTAPSARRATGQPTSEDR
jgi:hypothetical protein